jgi:hypothetical protein
VSAGFHETAHHADKDLASYGFVNPAVVEGFGFKGNVILFGAHQVCQGIGAPVNTIRDAIGGFFDINDIGGAADFL